MKIIRKIAAILVALSLSLMLFAGCQQQSAEKIDIGIIQLIENGAFNDMREWLYPADERERLRRQYRQLPL